MKKSDWLVEKKYRVDDEGKVVKYYCLSIWADECFGGQFDASEGHIEKVLKEVPIRFKSLEQIENYISTESE